MSDSILVKFVFKDKTYLGELDRVIGAWCDNRYDLHMYYEGPAGYGRYFRGTFQKGDDKKWTFTTQRGDFPEIAEQLIKFVEDKTE